MTNCIFCKIIAGEIPSAKVYEDDNVLVFLDISQSTPGHTLLIPKRHVMDIFEYDANLATQTFSYIPQIAKAIREAFPEMKGLNIVNNNGEMAGQSVFHSHIHFIPRYSTQDGYQHHYQNNMSKYTSEQLRERAAYIAQAIQ